MLESSLMTRIYTVSERCETFGFQRSAKNLQLLLSSLLAEVDATSERRVTAWPALRAVPDADVGDRT